MKKTITLLSMLALSWTATASANATYIHETLNDASIEKYAGLEAYNLTLNVGNKVVLRHVEICAEVEAADKASIQDTLHFALNKKLKVVASVRTNTSTEDIDGNFAGCIRDISISLGR